MAEVERLLCTFVKQPEITISMVLLRDQVKSMSHTNFAQGKEFPFDTAWFTVVVSSLHAGGTFASLLTDLLAVRAAR
jgi:hypothetical protein